MLTKIDNDQLKKKIQSDLSLSLISTDWIWTEWKRRRHAACAWKKPVTTTHESTDTTAKNKDTLYYYPRKLP